MANENQSTLAGSIHRAKQECEEIAYRKIDCIAEIRRIDARMAELDIAIRVAEQIMCQEHVA